MIRQMPCPERSRLLDLYAQATSELSHLVNALAEIALGYKREAFDRAWEQCEEAQKLCLDIRRQMYAHMNEHRCALEVPRLEKAI